MILRRSRLAGMALVAWPVFAQAPKITLRVVAHDSHDQPVGDLTADDFQVSDQGKSQHITLVQQPKTPATGCARALVTSLPLLRRIRSWFCSIF